MTIKTTKKIFQFFFFFFFQVKRNLLATYAHNIFPGLLFFISIFQQSNLVQGTPEPALSDLQLSLKPLSSQHTLTH